MLEGRNELITDFQQYYGLDLEKLFLSGEFARAKVLATNLPSSSRTVVRLNPELAWDENAYLLALIADNIAFMRFEQSNGKGKKPKPLQRPKKAEKKKEKKTLNVSDKRIQSLLFKPRK